MATTLTERKQKSPADPRAAAIARVEEIERAATAELPAAEKAKADADAAVAAHEYAKLLAKAKAATEELARVKGRRDQAVVTAKELRESLIPPQIKAAVQTIQDEIDATDQRKHATIGNALPGVDVKAVTDGCLRRIEKLNKAIGRLNHIGRTAVEWRSQLDEVLSGLDLLVQPGEKPTYTDVAVWK